MICTFKACDPIAAGTLQALKLLGRRRLRAKATTIVQRDYWRQGSARLGIDQRYVQAKVRRMLMIQGCASLRVHGCQFGGGNVPFGAKAFKRAMKKRGARVVWQGNTMLLRLV